MTSQSYSLFVKSYSLCVIEPCVSYITIFIVCLNVFIAPVMLFMMCVPKSGVLTV